MERHMNGVPYIHKVTVTTYTLPPHHATNGYVIGSDGEAVLIDPIYQPGGALEAHLAADGIRSLRYAAVTHPHPDHFGGLKRLLDRFGGSLAVHPEAADEAVFGLSGNGTTIEPFSGGEAIDTTHHRIRVLHTPGHNPAHLCFYIEKEGILFSGDTILGHGTSIISPPEGNMADYMQTLQMLAELEVRMICPAHGPVIEQNARRRIQWYMEHRRMREARVLAALKQGRSTLPEITQQIYTDEDFRMHGRGLLPRAQRSVLAHLEKLQKEGVVASQPSPRGPHYFLN